MPIDHVVVLALENRSFDHLLGYLAHPNPDFDGLTHGGPHTNPGWDGASAVATSPTAKRVLPIDPDHAHDAVMQQLGVAAKSDTPSNDGFITSYERKGRGLSQPHFGGLFGPVVAWWQKRSQATAKPISGRGPLIMACQPPEHVPVLSMLATSFGVCTRWFCSVPGETWPNRNFLHAATSDGETNIAVRFYRNRTIFELLETAGKRWHIYYDDTPQVWAFVNLWASEDRHANWYEITDFARHVAANQLPEYSFIEPNHRPPFHDLDHEPILGVPDVSDSQHPGNNLVSNAGYDTYNDNNPTDFARAEQLIAHVYETLRAHPDVFERTILVITYDEHGGLYDHVTPPTDVPSPDPPVGRIVPLLRHLFYRRSARFDFRMLGPRVPSIIVSPLVPAGTVDDTTREHASVPATLRALFAPNAAPLGPRDRSAARFDTLLRLQYPRTDLPDLSGYAPAAFAAAPLVTAPSDNTPVPLAPVPAHYQDLSRLAKKVGRRLRRRGVPEARRSPSTIPAQARPQHVTNAFTIAAERARETRSR